MRNRFSKKIFWGLILIILLGILSSGCVPTAPPPTTPPPATYTITVMSGSGAVFGSVYVNGLPTGDYVASWGGATVSGVPSGAAIYLVDPFGFVSHTEIFNPANGLVIVFNWF